MNVLPHGPPASGATEVVLVYERKHIVADAVVHAKVLLEARALDVMGYVVRDRNVGAAGVLSPTTITGILKNASQWQTCRLQCRTRCLHNRGSKR